MSYELRILSGLHRGAAMPLDDDSLLMGSSELADIVLVDPGIEEQHAKLSRTENGWVVLSEGGHLYVPEGPAPQKLVDIELGGFVRVGQVWMTIAEEGAPWEPPPPDPAPALLEEDDSASPAEEYSQEENEAHANADAAAETETEAMAKAVAPQRGEDESKQPPYLKNFSLRRALIAPLSVVAVLSGAGAYALTAKTPLPAAQKKIDMQSDLKKHNFDNGVQVAQTKAEEKNAVQQESVKLTPEELRHAFRKRLSDADLLKRFDLSLSDESWSMRGDLDATETARFERVLKGFIDEYKITFPLNAKVVSADDMLPFKVRQVVSGNQASIITEEGSRLYVGDEYRGVRVMSINGNKLVFAGKRKIEVVW